MQVAGKSMSTADRVHGDRLARAGRVRLKCCLTVTFKVPMVEENGKDLLGNQRAKVGRIKLADFFVPQMGMP